MHRCCREVLLPSILPQSPCTHGHALEVNRRQVIGSLYTQCDNRNEQCKQGSCTQTHAVCYVLLVLGQVVSWHAKAAPTQPECRGSFGAAAKYHSCRCQRTLGDLMQGYDLALRGSFLACKLWVSLISTSSSQKCSACDATAQLACGELLQYVGGCIMDKHEHPHPQSVGCSAAWLRAVTLRCGRSKCTIKARLAGRPVLSATLSPASVETSTCASALSAPRRSIVWRTMTGQRWTHSVIYGSSSDHILQARLSIVTCHNEHI